MPEGLCAEAVSSGVYARHAVQLQARAPRAKTTAAPQGTRAPSRSGHAITERTRHPLRLCEVVHAVTYSPAAAELGRVRIQGDAVAAAVRGAHLQVMWLGFSSGLQ